MMRVIRRGDLAWTPWKNGGGMMADLAVSPAGADFDRADWRVSMAKVERDSVFSQFPGMDRGMMLIAGDSLELHMDNADPQVVRGLGAAVEFPGDGPTRGVPRHGPIENLNVMVRRGITQHRMIRWTCEGASWLTVPAGGTTIAYVQHGDVPLPGVDDCVLHAGDTIVTTRPTRIYGTADLIEINLWPA